MNVILSVSYFLALRMNVKIYIPLLASLHVQLDCDKKTESLTITSQCRKMVRHTLRFV